MNYQSIKESLKGYNSQQKKINRQTNWESVEEIEEMEFEEEEKDENKISQVESMISGLSLCPQSSVSFSQNSSSPLHQLQSIKKFNNTRCIYALGYLFNEFVAKIKEYTKIPFKVLEEGDYYGVIHFDYAIATSKILKINNDNLFGMKFYASQKMRRQACMMELMQLAKEKKLCAEKNLFSQPQSSQISRNKKRQMQRNLNLRNMNAVNSRFDEDTESNSNSRDYNKSRYTSNSALDQHEKEENELFIELSNILLKNLTWEMSDLYLHILTFNDIKKRVNSAQILANPMWKSQFIAFINSRKEFLSNRNDQIPSLQQKQQEQQQLQNQQQQQQSQFPNPFISELTNNNIIQSTQIQNNFSTTKLESFDEKKYSNNSLNSGINNEQNILIENEQNISIEND